MPSRDHMPRGCFLTAVLVGLQRLDSCQEPTLMPASSTTITHHTSTVNQHKLARETWLAYVDPPLWRSHLSPMKAMSIAVVGIRQVQQAPTIIVTCRPLSCNLD